MQKVAKPKYQFVMSKEYPHKYLAAPDNFQRLFNLMNVGNNEIAERVRGVLLIFFVCRKANCLFFFLLVLAINFDYSGQIRTRPNIFNRSGQWQLFQIVVWVAYAQ